MSKWLIIGSTAAYHWFPDRRPPKDIDILTPAKIIGCEAKVCVVDSSWHEIADEIITLNKDPVFADPDILYTLKVSHAHWDIHWDKTLFDVHDMGMRGCQLNLPLYHKLVKLWETVHGQKRVNLNQSVETFWDDAVVRVHDHEALHEAVKFHARPMHERIRPDLSNTWCSEALFLALNPDERAECVLEEMMVTAIERFHLTAASSRREVMLAMHRGHKLLCTSMTKGWFARYLIVNRYDLLTTRREGWYGHLTNTLNHLPEALT
jgi:hypothetical protein